jgi:SAM-dependent methyltransferase
MAELWETAFTKNQMMWGAEPSRSALFARDTFARIGVKEVLVPGLGYGRNAKPFLEHGMSVTGIEISETAIGLARSRMGLDIPIHHGSVTDMPYDNRSYDGVFSYGLLYLLDAPARAKLLQDCHRQLRKGGVMIFTVIAKTAPMFGQGPKLGDDWYEVHPGVKMFFYDAESIRREFGMHGEIELFEIDEAAGGGGSLPFVNVVCTVG